jgi:glycosyltransferase involved in cell wall biosynthesis
MVQRAGLTFLQMQTNSISVTLGLGSDPHHKRLPEVLLRHGMLRRMLRFGPELEVLDPDGTGSLKVRRRFPEYKMVNRFVWATWKRLPGTGSSQLPKVATCWLADRLASVYVPPSNIFHGWLAVCLACLKAAKRQDAITIVQNPTLHLQHWQDEVMVERNHFGIDPRICGSVLPTSLIRRVQREYEMCDSIIVLSSVAKRSFEQFGYANKTIVVSPGVDHLFFRPTAKPSARTLFRVCYVGRVEVAKGIGYLLDAWKRLALAGAELLLIGEIQPEGKALLGKYLSNNVKLLGWLPPQELAEHYRQSSILVLPSVNEGMGLVLLEAMACGLPVIASDRTGAPDCVADGKEGFVIPARDVEALTETILWCYRHPDAIMAMGSAARARVEREFTLSHYEDRQIALYRSLVGAQKARVAPSHF